MAQSTEAKAKRRAYEKAYWSRPENLERKRAQSREYAKTGYYRRKNRERHQKLRTEVLSHYGGSPPKCVCCGEATEKFLSIDHVNGGGREHRRRMRASSIYEGLRKEGLPGGFQVLCYNCNCAKGFYGTCPHEEGE